MYKKGKGVVFYSKPIYGFGGSEDAKTRLKHQTLVQEYMELQEGRYSPFINLALKGIRSIWRENYKVKFVISSTWNPKETETVRTKFEAAKHRKLMLAAEVRFLCERHKLLAETTSMHALLQNEKLVQPPNSLPQIKNKKKQLLSTKGNNQYTLPPRPEPKLKKRRYRGEEIGTPSSSSIIDHNIKKKIRSGKETTSVLNYNRRINISRERIAWKAPVFDLNLNDTDLRKSFPPFGLNQDNSSFSGKEAYLPTRAPIFDLNEISTGDEDLYNNNNNVEAVKYGEVRKSLISRGINDEHQKDLKLTICRNEGEGSSHVGKRKISWQDPVALRV